MDELKINFGTNFMRSMIAKIIRKLIKKKTGSEVDILINQIVVTGTDGKIHVHADIDAELTNQEFMKLIKSIGLD